MLKFMNILLKKLQTNIKLFSILRKKRYIPQKDSRGFTILETLIAITVLVFAITGPLSLVAGSIRSSGYARDSITAFYLAQEAVEYIRNMRDINALNENLTSANWLDNIESGTGAGGPYVCMNDYGSEISKCSLQNSTGVYSLYQCDAITIPAGDCLPLPFSGALGTIPYGGGSIEESEFTRNIWLERVPDGQGGSSAEHQVIVNVLIKWRTGSVDNEFLLREYLTNWKSEQTL